MKSEENWFKKLVCYTDCFHYNIIETTYIIKNIYSFSIVSNICAGFVKLMNFWILVNTKMILK